MAVYVDGRRVITNAPGAVVRSKSQNYTNSKRDTVQEYDNICKSEDLINCSDNYFIDGYAVATIDSIFPKVMVTKAAVAAALNPARLMALAALLQHLKPLLRDLKMAE